MNVKGGVQFDFSPTADVNNVHRALPAKRWSDVIEPTSLFSMEDAGNMFLKWVDALFVIMWLLRVFSITVMNICPKEIVLFH